MLLWPRDSTGFPNIGPQVFFRMPARWIYFWFWLTTLCRPAFRRFVRQVKLHCAAHKVLAIWMIACFLQGAFKLKPVCTVGPQYNVFLLLLPSLPSPPPFQKRLLVIFYCLNGTRVLKTRLDWPVKHESVWDPLVPVSKVWNSFYEFAQNRGRETPEPMVLVPTGFWY